MPYQCLLNITTAFIEEYSFAHESVREKEENSGNIIKSPLTDLEQALKLGKASRDRNVHCGNTVAVDGLGLGAVCNQSSGNLNRSVGLPCNLFTHLIPLRDSRIQKRLSRCIRATLLPTTIPTTLKRQQAI